ncbi:MAG: MBOAT family O-acyltransferase [Bacteroidota bacterium]
MPFSNHEFYLFLAVSVIFVLLLKFLGKKIPYHLALFLVSALYLLLLFPKPLHFVAFVLYGFFVFKFLGRKLQLSGVWPVLIYVVPLIVMKLTHVIPAFKSDGSVVSLVFQIAGLSYATFKMMQVYIDERETERRISFISYFNFIAFTPTLLIGPIDRYGRFQQNVEEGYASISSANFNAGLDFFIRGLLYKYIFAHAIWVLLLGHLDGLTGPVYHAAYMYTYVFYLFFDFAGYSLLAMGFGYMLGIRVPYNFDKPFLAQNPKEFWHRWHKTLGDWLNDYFFKPIFKELTSRKVLKPIQRQSIALFLTFTLMGFWNGFELHYIVSGMLFGLYSVGYNYYNYQCKKNGRDVIFGSMSAAGVKYISIFVVFHLVAFSIYVFSGNLF